MAASRREFHRLRVTLIGSDPEIWRTFDVDASLSLAELHDALRIVMGWRDQHLHMFVDTDPYARSSGIPRIGRPERRWIMPDPFGDGPDGEPEEGTTVREAFAHDGPLYYEYDFGDGWMHRLDLIERGPMERGEPTAALVRGELRAPYENSRGVYGFAEMQALLADPTAAEHQDLAAWVRDTVGPWTPADPAFFDPEGVQAELDLRFGPTSTDMSGLLDGPDGVTVSSPIVELLTALPVSARSELRAHLRRSGALDDTRPDAATVARMLAPLRWLIETVGAEGIALTTAGWMPPALVLDGMTRLGWRDRWIGEANREDITVPMRHFRAAAQRMGIVRVRQGRLLLGADAKKALADPARMWRLVTSRVLRGLSDAERDASVLLILALADGTLDSMSGAHDPVGFGLGVLGWSPRGARGFAPQVVGDLTARLSDVLDVVGVFEPGRRHTAPAVTPEGRMFARAALR